MLVPASDALSKRRRLAGPLPVDVFKLRHRGSRANVTQELNRAVQAKHHVFSTSGAIFNHPDDEAVARVIVGSKRPFNYDTPHTRHWAAQELIEKHGRAARYSSRPGAGVVMELPSHGD